MKLHITIGMVFYCLSANADYWTQMASFPGPGRGHPFSFSIGTKGYVGGGDIGTDDFWEYDPASNTWTQKADCGGGTVNSAVGFSINGKGYAATGNFGVELWEYDPVADTWTPRANLPAAGRNYASGFAIGNKGYVGGGFLGMLNDFWEWDQLTDQWTQKSNLPSGIAYSAAFSINGKGYFSTGSNAVLLNITWEYDTLTDVWTQKANFPGAARMDAAAFSICEKGYLGLGGELPYYNDMWQFNPVLNQWIQKTNFPATVRDDAAYFSIGNKGYMGMGQYNNAINYVDFWEYTPDSACGIQPTALFSAPNQICPGTCTDFINQSTGATSYLWMFPGSGTVSSTDVNPSNICYATPGSYDVILIATGASGSDTLLLPGYIVVFPAPPPQSIMQAGDTLFANTGAVGYQWYFNGNLISGATNYFYIATTGGDYNVIATDGNGCEVEAAIYDVIAAVSPLSSTEGMNLFPNPVKEHLWLTLPFEKNERTISLYNSTGEKIYSKIIKGGVVKLMIDTGWLVPGIYFVEETTGRNRKHTGKFVKQDE